MVFHSVPVFPMGFPIVPLRKPGPGNQAPLGGRSRMVAPGVPAGRLRDTGEAWKTELINGDYI